MILEKVEAMRGKRLLAWSVPVLATMVFCIGCGKSGKTTKGDSLSGTAVVATISDSTGYAVSQKDPFNPANAVESTRKLKPGAFGMYKGEKPPETPTIESVGVILSSGEGPKLSVGIFDNSIITRTSYPFDYENDNAAMKSLHDLHALDKVVLNDMNDLEKAVALMSYTKKFLDGGAIPGPDAEAGPSAFLITKNRREKGLGGGSDIYSALMCQLVLSCGMTARLVGMHTLDDSGKPLPYDVCEVFLNQKQKWVVFDPFTRATYFTKGGNPLSALEIHTLVAENRVREATPVSLSGDILDIASVRDQVISRFRFIYIWRMNDILGKSPRNGSIPWKTLYQSHLVWEDPYSPIGSGGFDKVERFADGGVRYVTHTRSDFEWTLNGVNITIQRVGPTKIAYHFDTVTPNFERFETTAKGKPAKSGNILMLDNKEQSVVVSSVNARGVKGPVSFVDIIGE